MSKITEKEGEDTGDIENYKSDVSDRNDSPTKFIVPHGGDANTYEFHHDEKKETVIKPGPLFNKKGLRSSKNNRYQSNEEDLVHFSDELSFDNLRKEIKIENQLE